MQIPAQAAPDYRLTRPTDPPGQLNIYLTVIDGKIIVDFGRPVQWVGLTPEEADKLADEMKDAARNARLLHLGG